MVYRIRFCRSYDHVNRSITYHKCLQLWELAPISSFTATNFQSFCSFFSRKGKKNVLVRWKHTDISFTCFSAARTLQKVRAFCFYVTTYIVALPLFCVMLLMQPFVLVFDRHRRKAQHFINKIWSHLTILFFYKAEIHGLENLPGPDEPAVYVSNHQSFLDIYSLFLLGRPFKFISKTSNFWIPIIGWSMYLTGHVPLRRMDTRSQMVNILLRTKTFSSHTLMPT